MCGCLNLDTSDVNNLIYDANRYRIEESSVTPYILSEIDFPSADDPRTVWLILSGVSAVQIPDDLIVPVGSFLIIKQGNGTQITYSATGTASLEVPLTTENKSGGQNTKQTLTQEADGAWDLGGRTSA